MTSFISGKKFRAARASKLIDPSANKLITWTPPMRVSLISRNMVWNHWDANLGDLKMIWILRSVIFTDSKEK